MAEFLTTIGNSYQIEQIIIKAEKSLTLVTPYLSLSKILFDRLADADKKGIKITLIYGKSELNKKEENKLNTLKNIEIYFCENLHAKCYFNEQAIIITSMNLYEFSEKNNREMGVLIDKKDDFQIFEDTLKEVESIKNSSKQTKKPVEKNEINDLIYLSDDKTDTCNFYHPSLYRVLKDKLGKNYNIDYEEQKNGILTICIVTIHNYPIEDIYIVINSRIDFYFKNTLFFNFLETHYSDKIKDTFNSRYFWNSKRINVYREKGSTIEINQAGLIKETEWYLAVIENTIEQIKLANNEYQKLSNITKLQYR